MQDNLDITRRGALTAFGGVALMARPHRALGANERVRVALCGVRGRGTDHLKNYSKLPNVEIAAICDIDERVRAKCLSNMDQMGIAKPKTYTDIRKLLEDKSIDAISIATPNHWHALMAIWGCQAGKDVYVEKPCTHNLWEGRQLIKAAKRYNRIVQHGTQIRSTAVVRDAIKRVHEGYLGDVYMARGVCFKWRDTIGRAAEEPVPAGVDYDLWTGPAPTQPFTRNRFHYNWHWNFTMAMGISATRACMSSMSPVGHWGRLPRESAIGGHFMLTMIRTRRTISLRVRIQAARWQTWMISFEVRHWMRNHEAGIGTPELAARTEEQITLSATFCTARRASFRLRMKIWGI